jgi:hypothetical protein
MRSRRYPALGLAVAATVCALVAGCSRSGTTTPSGGGSGGGSASGSPGASAGQAGGGGTGGGSGGGKVAAVRACALITGAEAATALGLGAPLTATTDTETACEYQGPNQADSVSIDVETQKYQPGTEDTVVNMLGKDMAKKVDGLGDAAFAVNLNSQLQYHIWAKGRYLLIVVSKAGTNLDAPAKTVARTAVSRL